MNIRSFKPGDLSHLLALNNAAVPAVNALGAEDLLDLINMALVALVAESDDTPHGMLLCLGEGTDYQSANYRWLSERYANFAYTDRIFIDETLRGQKAGEALYRELFRQQAGSGRCFLCEVNKRPPNPGSVRFHAKLGFEKIGTADHGDKAVIFMQRAPEPAAT